MIKVALIDDHVLFRKGLVEIVNSFNNYKVELEADHGKDFFEKIQAARNLPDIAILDIHMPEMDGYETASLLAAQYPNIKILILSMQDQEHAVIRMLRIGVKGYILKDAEPYELRNALDSLAKKGFYYSDLVSGTLINSLNVSPQASLKRKRGLKVNALSEKEIEFIKLLCSELTYKEIAEAMGISLRTADGYREKVFEKLQVKNRIGIVIYALKHELISLQSL